jgi:hypothetical protein
VTEADLVAAIGRFAEWVVSKGLSAPALAFLEMHRPLRGIVGAGALVLEPTIMLLFGRRRAALLRSLVEDPTIVARVIDAIETHVVAAQIAAGKSKSLNAASPVVPPSSEAHGS